MYSIHPIQKLSIFADFVTPFQWNVFPSIQTVPSPGVHIAICRYTRDINLAVNFRKHQIYRQYRLWARLWFLQIYKKDIKACQGTVYPNKYAHGFCFAVLCCGYTLTDFPISIRLTSLALWQSNDCPSASKATLMNMDKYFMWIHFERLHNHTKAKHNKTVCIFLGYTLWVPFPSAI